MTLARHRPPRHRRRTPRRPHDRAAAGAAPTLVLLHEGLGCVACGASFPRSSRKRTGCGVLVYSRPATASPTVTLPRPLDYMHDEAPEVLPAAARRGRHSRAASWSGTATAPRSPRIYAGSQQDLRVRGLVLMAPHFFVEDARSRSNPQATQAYETATCARGSRAITRTSMWRSAAGTTPGSIRSFARAFDITEALAHIRVPMLMMQGEDDHYGTLAQLARRAGGKLLPGRDAVMPGAGHAPHRRQAGGRRLPRSPPLPTAFSPPRRARQRGVISMRGGLPWSRQAL